MKVALLGFSERSLRTLVIFFERHLADSCVPSEQDIADASLIDFDALDAKNLLEVEQATRPDQPRILLATNPEACRVPGAVLVRKPVKMDILLSILLNLRHKIFQPRRMTAEQLAAILSKNTRAADYSHHSHNPTRQFVLAGLPATEKNFREKFHYIGSMPDVDLENPGEREKIFYAPQQFLQGFVEQAFTLGIGNGSVVRLSGPAFGRITIYPFARKITVHTASYSLSTVSRIPLGEADVKIELLPDAPQFPPETESLETLDAFLWKLALWASRGRLPLGTDLNSPLVLKRWPNLPRLLPAPHATRIAGLWAREPIVLSRSLKALNIPQRHVFAFYSACAAQGIVVPAKRALDPLLISAPSKYNQEPGLFGKLTKRIMGNRKSTLKSTHGRR